MYRKHDNHSNRTLCAQGLGWIDEVTKSVTPPIYPSTTYQRNADLSYHEGRVYTRADNPTYDQVSQLIARLENGFQAQLFASGMAAATALFQLLKPGDHVIIPEDVYSGVTKWFEAYAEPGGIEFDAIPNNDLTALEQKLRPNRTRIVWLESPSNPEWVVTDITSAAKIAHEVDAIVVADNTVSTPVLTRPLDLGVDIVMHSATKYLSGHGDVLAGVLVAREDSELWQRVLGIAHDAGALPGPFEAWLLLRGIRTLYLRVEQICTNAQALAEHFEKHPKITHVLYPGLPGFPDHDIAKRQMNGGFGGMMSLRFAGGYDAAVAVQANCQVFVRATSLGSVESLIEHRASYLGPDTKVPQDMLRLSIGIEDVNDLISDLENAMRKV
jgi:cystathionine gamma-synthase